jgi:hypothetical protein
MKKIPRCNIICYGGFFMGYCLCLQQSGLWILDVARPVGRALKDDGREGSHYKDRTLTASVIARSGIYARRGNPPYGTHIKDSLS